MVAAVAVLRMSLTSTVAARATESVMGWQAAARAKQPDPVACSQECVAMPAIATTGGLLQSTGQEGLKQATDWAIGH